MRRPNVALACAAVIALAVPDRGRADETITEKLRIPFKSSKDWPVGPHSIAPCRVYMAEYERYCMPGGPRAGADEKALKDQGCNDIIKYLNAHCGK